MNAVFAMFHVPTFLVVMAGIGLLSATLIYSLARSYPSTIRGLHEQAAAFAIIAACQVLLAVRGPLPPMWLVWLPNVLQCVAVSLVAAAMLRFHGRRRRRPALVALCVVNAALAAFAVSHPEHSRLAWGGVAFCVGIGAMWAAVGATARPVRSTSFGAWTVTLGMSVLGTVCLMRAGSIFMGAEAAAAPARAGTIAFMFINALAMCATCLGTALMASERLSEELRDIADRDALTGVCNRRAFFAEAQRRAAGLSLHGGACRRGAGPAAAWGVATRRDREVAADGFVPSARLGIVQIDLDHFKRLNDTHGHPIGDKALAAMGRLLANSLHANDIAGRLGGEEFAALIAEPSNEALLAVGDRILRAARTTGPDTTDCPAFTVSVGLALGAPGESLKDCMVRADRAMYAAKHAGRDRMVLAEPHQAHDHEAAAGAPAVAPLMSAAPAL